MTMPDSESTALKGQKIRVRYSQQLEGLSPEERAALVGRWKSYLENQTRPRYNASLRRLTRDFGPDFANEVVTPIATKEEPEVPPIDLTKAVPSEPPKPWWQNVVGLKQVVEGIGTLYDPLYQAGNWWNQRVAVPNAMTITSLLNPTLRENMRKAGATGVGPLALGSTISVPEREELWQNSGIGMGARMVAEIAFDPLTWFPGWGLSTKAVKGLEKAGEVGKLAANVLRPISRFEEAYIKASDIPVKLAGQGLRAVTGSLLLPSKKAITALVPFDAYDALSDIQRAATVKAQPIRKVLNDLKSGIIDPDFVKVVVAPRRQRALDWLIKYKDNLNLEMVARNADLAPDTAKAIIANTLLPFVANELGVKPRTIMPGVLGTGQKIWGKVYNGWRRLVLNTPTYVLQNFMENNLRQLSEGISPNYSLREFFATKAFEEAPIDIQRRLVSLSDRLNKRIPDDLGNPLLHRPQMANAIEAMSGAMASGKVEFPRTVASWLDDNAYTNIYANARKRYIEDALTTDPVLTQQWATLKSKINAIRPEARPVPISVDKWNLVHPRDQAIVMGLMSEVPDAYKAAKVMEFFVDPNMAKGQLGYYVPPVKGAINPQRVATLDVMDPDTLYHELNHAYVFSNALTGDFGDLIDYLEKSGYTLQADSLKKLIQNAPNNRPTADDFNLWNSGWKYPEQPIERYARDFSDYMMEYDPALPNPAKGYKNQLSEQERRDRLAYFEARFPRKSTLDPALINLLDEAITTMPIPDMLKAFDDNIRDSFSRAIMVPDNVWEQGLASSIQSEINDSLPRLWAKGDIAGINAMFDRLEDTLGSQLMDYQKQVMIQNLRAFRNQIRDGIPDKWKTKITKLMDKFKYERVIEREANLASAKSIGEYQSKMLEMSRDYRRELEQLMQATILSHVAANGIDDDIYWRWSEIADDINNVTFKESDDFTADTLNLSHAVHGHAGNADQQWLSYIQSIQSKFPDQATQLARISPDTDVLWSTYRSIQEQRWLDVGQQKLRAMGVSLKDLPTPVGANGKFITLEDFMQTQKGGLRSWKSRIAKAFYKRNLMNTKRIGILNQLRTDALNLRESIELQHQLIRNQGQQYGIKVADATMGNYANRTNLDEFMTSVGIPFWFFPSRSIPYYATQAIRKPGLATELFNIQNRADNDNQPARLFGTIHIPGTDFYYNPIQSTFMWQLANPNQFTSNSLGPLESAEQFMRNYLGISVGPQYKIVSQIINRTMNKKMGEDEITAEPAPIIPQAKWLKAIEGLKLPGVSQLARAMSEPFDMYVRAVYGDEVAGWEQREVEKYLVDAGYDPAELPDLPDKVVQDAWKRYYLRQLISIPIGQFKELTDTEEARFKAIAAKSKELGLSEEQRVAFKKSGDSPFTGLRQDQLEALYADIPAQKLWRNIRPSGLTNKTEPYWEQWRTYRLEREELRGDPINPAKGTRLYNERTYDQLLQDNKITPSEWKDLYRQNYQWYSDSVARLGLDYKLAPKTSADWEAFRKMMNWEQPVRHPDDIKLDEYYDVMDPAKFESTEVPGEFDYDKYRETETQFLSALSPETVQYIMDRKDKYKSTLRATYSKQMAEVQPYYDLYDLVMQDFTPDVVQLVDYANKSADSTIQREILRRSPQALIALRRVRKTREAFRRQNPSIDRILSYWNR